MTSSSRRIDWAGLMRAGLHGLGLKPGEFWALTPLELMLMLGREAGDAGFSRASLDALMAQFPDDPAHRNPKGGE
ncbi:rcc01693 family protein [Pararhodobacter sp. SW119]|uniref:rcc01693 family protein n=1 Tax=Pararhodobacter sp. SW119 TaxID=2780075 RepID=UPI001AE0D493|nr:rcc01693 family protein [Pararhodobacter sp. SW119]